MTRMTRIIVTALATLTLASPVATAMADDETPAGPGGSVGIQPGTSLRAQSGADTCAQGSRIVHGLAGTGCTTSSSNNSAEYGVLALGIGGMAVLAIALGTRPETRRRQRHPSTAVAFSERSS